MGERESEGKSKEYFLKYYSESKIQAPERLQAREIGFIPFFGTMSRHRKVNSIKEMDAFVRSTIPRHLYYSAAYYRKPDEKRMQDKEWMGAELIFDLDGDHVLTEKKISYEDTLEMIKEHTMRLIDRYLIRDMGFHEDDIKIFFSGGRGYHVHVLSDRVYSMTSDSRREIASYIKGDGLSLEDFLRIHRSSPPNHGGWVEEVSASIMQTLAERSSKNSPVAQIEINNLPSAGINTQKAAVRAMGETIKKDMAEIDDPVTTDVHRLIRYPGSLHGKTGFAVSEVAHDDIANFDPLESCIPEIFTRGEEKIEVASPFSIKLLGNNYKLKKGKATAPLHVALYGVLSGNAQFILNID